MYHCNIYYNKKNFNIYYPTKKNEMQFYIKLYTNTDNP